MHEFSICQEIVTSVLAEMEKVGAPCRLIKTTVLAGKLRQIVPEYLTFAYETLTKDTVAEGSTLEVEVVPIIIHCQQCGWSGEVEGEYFFYCVACKSNKVEVKSGKELYLKSLEVEKDE
jgi:hydrogenase nickel incorporation protein HypA/HybF